MLAKQTSIPVSQRQCPHQKRLRKQSLLHCICWLGPAPRLPALSFFGLMPVSYIAKTHVSTSPMDHPPSPDLPRFPLALRRTLAGCCLGVGADADPESGRLRQPAQIPGRGIRRAQRHPGGSAAGNGASGTVATGAGALHLEPMSGLAGKRPHRPDAGRGAHPGSQPAFCLPSNASAAKLVASL